MHGVLLCVHEVLKLKVIKNVRLYLMLFVSKRVWKWADRIDKKTTTQNQHVRRQRGGTGKLVIQSHLASTYICANGHSRRKSHSHKLQIEQKRNLLWSRFIFEEVNCNLFAMMHWLTLKWVKINRLFYVNKRRCDHRLIWLRLFWKCIYIANKNHNHYIFLSFVGKNR